jgi:hypothetical protein
MIGNHGGNWKLRPTLHKELWLKKLREANFEHFWLVVWPQVTNKC